MTVGNNRINTTVLSDGVRAAHRAMQVHVRCCADACPVKSAAWTVLVEAGRVTPASDYDRCGR